MGAAQTLIVQVPSSHAAERRYVLDVVLRVWLGLDYQVRAEDRTTVRISMAGSLGGRSLEIDDAFFAIERAHWLDPVATPNGIVGHVATDPLPGAGSDIPFEGLPYAADLPVFFGARDRHRHAVRCGSDHLALTVDIFGTVFFFITRYEELGRDVRDRHGRFPAAASLAVREGLIRRPIVDEYVDVLWSAIRSLWPGLRRRQTAFELLLTHDVDQPWSTWRQPMIRLLRSSGVDILRRRRPSLVWRRLWAASAPDGRRMERDPFDTFDLLMDASERHSSRATFFFLAGNEPGETDFRYRITDPPVLRLLRRVAGRGHEIGLHGSLASVRSEGRIGHELGALRRACEELGTSQDRWGVRQHFLRFDNPETWRGQEAAGLDYDSTLGFAETPGFRAGTCRDYPTFDLTTGRTLRLWERPLVVMDTTLFEYMRLSTDQAWATIRELVRTCRRHEGRAVVLIHNNSLPVFGFDRGFREMIADLLSVG